MTNNGTKSSAANPARAKGGTRVSVTQGGRRPGRNIGSVTMNHSQHKRDLELYNSFMRAAGEGDRSQKPSDTKKLLSSMGITASAGFGPTTGSEASK